MRYVVRHAPLVLLAFLLAGLVSPPASAAEGRHPQTGAPAYTYTLPAGWTSQEGSLGNLLLLNSTRTAVVVILNVPSTDPLEKFAMDAFKTSNSVPSDRAPEPTEISGYTGSTWLATITRPDGVKLELAMSVVRIDAGQVASASVILSSAATPEQVSEARLVRSALKLVTQ